MEATLGISLYSCVYPKLAKMICFSYYLLCFLFNKITEGVGTSSAWKWLEGGREGGTKTMYTHVNKCKNDKIKGENKQTNKQTRAGW
jgi:hypothetical protein